MSIEGITANLKGSDFKITQDNTVYVKTNGNPGILLVHATWCGHCKHFVPTFKQISQKLNKNSVTYPCLAIESEYLNKDGGVLASALGIEGFPTIKFFDQYGKIIGDYNGARDESNILDNICKVYHHCINDH